MYLFNKTRFGDKSKNAFKLIGASTIAQALTILASPIITRIFTPEDMGIYALFASYVIIASVFSTGKYDQAIILPKIHKHAAILVKICSFINIIFAVVLSLILYFLVSFYPHLFVKFTPIEIIYLIPLIVFVGGFYQVHYYLCIRYKRFNRIAFNKILQSSVSALISILAGFLTLKHAGLVWALFSSKLISAIQMYTKADIRREKIKLSEVFFILKKYKDCPKYLIISNLLNSMTNQIPILAITFLFSPAFTGLFVLAQKILRVPMSTIAVAISDIFKSYASEQFIKSNNCKDIYVKTLMSLIVISSPVFIIFFFIAPMLFDFVFGSDWRGAGYIAQILTPLIFMQFISSPLSSMYIIAQRQKLDGLFQLALLIATALPFASSYLFDLDQNITLILYSSCYSLLYAVNIYVTWKFAQNEENT